MTFTEQEKLELQTAGVEPTLNKPITTKFLLTFTIPTIISFVLMAIFGMVDGVFASRGISIEALSAVNFVMPFMNVSMAIGSMLAMGGAALVAKKKGKGLISEARENFSLIAFVTFSLGLIISVFGWLFRTEILELLGTDPFVFDLALAYIGPLILMSPLIMLGFVFTQFLIAEGKPVLGMISTVSGSIVSTSLNALFIFGLELGIMSLAWASAIGFSVPAVIGLFYFTLNRNGTIYFVRPKWDFKALSRSSMNGVSEMVTMLSGSVTTAVMNNVLVDLVGFEGVAAAGIVMGIQFIFVSLFLGYSTGVAPIVSYNYGKERSDKLVKLYKKSLIIVAVLSLIAIVFAVALAGLLAQIYVPAGTPVHVMTVRGVRLASIGFLLMGFNVFATNWFTAFNDGLVSGVMSFMRTMVFTVTLLVT
ncbi:MAG: MATE family efflux transporter, partial [Turicibacter sp.]|nr:MATE family efflux transporter [Turicibacter sp.]